MSSSLFFIKNRFKTNNKNILWQQKAWILAGLTENFVGFNSLWFIVLEIKAYRQDRHTEIHIININPKNHNEKTEKINGKTKVSKQKPKLSLDN